MKQAATTMRMRSLAIMTRAAIEAVEHDARDGSGEHGRDGAGKHHAADHERRARSSQGEAEDGDVVEVIADFADHLAHHV